MKAYKLTLATLLLCFFFNCELRAQPTSIISLEIIPTNPTTNDTVIIISKTINGTSPCWHTGLTVNVLNDTIYMSALNSGFGVLMTCYSLDTMTIGLLNSGTYELIYSLLASYTATIMDIDTISFSVQQATGHKTTHFTSLGISLYPNPATTEIKIDLKDHSTNSYTFEFYSLLGQKINENK